MGEWKKKRKFLSSFLLITISLAITELVSFLIFFSESFNYSFTLGANSIAGVLHTAQIDTLQLYFVDFVLNLSSIISKAELSLAQHCCYLLDSCMNLSFLLCFRRQKAIIWETNEKGKTNQEIKEEYIKIQKLKFGESFFICAFILYLYRDFLLFISWLSSCISPTQDSSLRVNHTKTVM